MDYPSTKEIESFSSETAVLSSALSKVTLPCVVLVSSESRGAQSTGNENVDNSLHRHGSEDVIGKTNSMLAGESTNEFCSKDELTKSLKGSVIAVFERTLIQTVRLRIMKFDTPTRQELAYGHEFVQQHKEQVGQEVRIPLKYKGKVNLLSSVKRGKHYFNISQVIKDFPPCIRVEEEITVINDNGRGCNVLPRGLQLNLIRVDDSSEEAGKNEILVCRCDSTVLNLPSICKGHFTSSTDDTDYILQEIMEKIPVPKTVTFKKLERKDFISVSEVDNDRLFNALSGPVEILAVEDIDTYIGCEHQKSVNMLYNIVVLPTFLNLPVHLPKDVLNTNRLLDEYFSKPTSKFVTFIQLNLFSLGSVSCVPIYLKFPDFEKSSLKEDFSQHEKEMKLSCPLYDSPSASTLPRKHPGSKDSGPQPTGKITHKEGVRKRITQVEESLQRLLMNESDLAKIMDNKERAGYEGQCSVVPCTGEQLEPFPCDPRQEYEPENTNKPHSMSEYTVLFRDVDNYDMAVEDSGDYESINVKDNEYEYVSLPHGTSSLTSFYEGKQDETSRSFTGSKYGCFTELSQEDSECLTPAYENLETSKIMKNKEIIAPGDPQKHGTADLSNSSHKAGLYENVKYK